MRIALLSILSACCFLCLSFQHYADTNNKIKAVKGDLNKDGLADSAIVTQDTAAATSPYRLRVFFQQPSGKYVLVVSTDSAITPQFPNGKDGFDPGNEFGDLTIDNGILTIGYQLLRGDYNHKFRYQNGNFELIGFTDNESDGVGTCSSVDFNLSTGIRIEKTAHCDTDKLISNVKKKIVIKPLPKLQNFTPFESELY